MNESSSCRCAPAAAPPAMGIFPVQEWHEPYELNAALYHGTIFPDLNLVFHAARDIPSPFSELSGKELSEQEKALNAISATGFALNDLTLYLDTHPGCQSGIRLMKQLLKKRYDELADYASRYCALTQLSVLTGKPDSEAFEWDEGPAPWEGGLI